MIKSLLASDMVSANAQKAIALIGSEFASVMVTNLPGDRAPTGFDTKAITLASFLSYPDRRRPLSERHFSRASAIGCRQPVRLRQEEVVGAAVIKLQKSILDLGLRRDFSSVENVTDPNPILGERASNEEATVTIERITLGAQKSDAIVFSPFNHTAQSSGKRRGLRHLLVISHAVAVEMGLLGTAAELVAKENIQNSVLTEVLSQFVTIEVRAAPGIGRCTNIGHRRHTGAT